MLNAVLNGKTHGILRQDYAGEFEGYEDLLTATVFERLFYLSAPQQEVIFDCLLQRAGVDRRAADLGALQAYEFWPQWPTTAGGKTEPDIYVKFARADLIVEAKRWDVAQQAFEQWAREIQAWQHQHSGRPLLLLAIGGLSEYDVWHVAALKGQAVASAAFLHHGLAATAFDLLAVSWRQLAVILRAQLTQNSLVTSDRFIVSDILSGLALHGINTAEQRFFHQLTGDLTRLALDISDAALAAFKPKGSFDAAFRPIPLAPGKGA